MSNAPPLETRVLYKPVASGKAFRVERRSAARWGWNKVQEFATLPHALTVYPDAVAETLAQKQQAHIESFRHRFVERLSDPKCWICGRPRDWAIHLGGAQ